MIEVRGLTETFTSGVFRKRTVRAVTDVSFSIPEEKHWDLRG
ncbi:MAG: hypothetical protein ACLTXL_04885 [Clostridia bacterium]